MKFSIFLAVVAINVLFVSAQKPPRAKTIGWTEWTDTLAFRNGPIPLMQEYGPQSDSLSQIYGGVFYNIEQVYYPILTVADYYLWFTRRYDFLFRSDIATYEQYYVEGDHKGMIKYVSENYKGKKFPIKIDLYDPSYPKEDYYPIGNKKNRSKSN